MIYDFNKEINRRGTDSVKHDGCELFFGTEDVLPLWVADMDFEVPRLISEKIKLRAEHPVYGYSFRPRGTRDSIVKWMKKRHNWDIQKEWIDFCPGVVPSLNLALLAFTNPGDKVIVQPPVYYPFFSAVRNNHCELVYNPLILKNGRLCIDFDDLERKVDEKVKVLFFCSPQNPGGSVWRKEEIEQLMELCIKHNIIVVSDEIHADIVYEGHKHLPTASVSDEVACNVLTFNAPSKTFNIAGLSTSYSIIPDNGLRKKYHEALERIHVHQGNIFGAIALKAAYDEGEEWLDELLAYLKRNINYVVQFIEDNIPDIIPVMPESTYLLWLDCRRLPFQNQDELNSFMINKAKLGLNNGVSFGPGGEGFMRINIASPLHIIKQAMEQLRKAINENLY